MKRTLIALGVAATVALPVAAQAAPKVYGKLNVTVEDYKKSFDNPATAEQKYTRLMSNASRFGVKGEDELTASLSAVYQIEWEVAADGEDATGGATGKADLSQRNRYVGLKSIDFGTLKLGKYDSYLKLAQGEIDLFNDLEGDMKYVIAGENRLNNVVGYESPVFAGLQINLQAQTQDANQTTGNSGVASTGGRSFSVTYTNEEIGLYAALAFDDNINGSTAVSGTRESDQIRLVASYKIADLTLNGIYNTSKASVGTVDNKESAWQLGAAYKIGDETLKAQFGQADADEASSAIQSHKLWSVGADHNFTSKTKAFAFYTSKQEEKKPATPSGDSEVSVFGLGLEHKF